MKHTARVFLMILVFSLPLFPQKAQRTNWKGQIEYEHGVKVVINPIEPLYGEVELDLEEDLIIGKEGDENFMFFKWLSLDVDQDGNIFVMDRGSHRVQKFNKKGEYIQTIGREGQGPGEFSEPTYLTLDEAWNIYVKDGVRANIFDKNGKFVKSFPIPLNSRHFKITEDGNFLGERMTIRPPDELSEDVVLMDDKSKVLKTIASFYSIKMNSMFNRKDNYSIQVPELMYCPGIKDYAVYGFPSEYRLYVVDSGGEIQAIFEIEERAERISGKERNKIIDVIMETRKSRKSARQESREEVEKSVLISKFRPFFEKIRIDENGNIYAEKLTSYLNEDGGYEFDFFNNDGQYLYRLKIPMGIRNINVIKYGCVFCAPYNQETGYFQVKRYRIINWDRIENGR